MGRVSSMHSRFALSPAFSWKLWIYPVGKLAVLFRINKAGT